MINAHRYFPGHTQAELKEIESCAAFLMEMFHNHEGNAIRWMQEKRKEYSGQVPDNPVAIVNHYKKITEN